MALIDGGERWCVHKWDMTEPMMKYKVGDYKLGPKYRYTDGYTCLRCGAKSSFGLGSPPNFMNYSLPFFLFIGVIGGFMVATKWMPFVIVPAICFVTLAWWVREVLK